MRLPLSPPAPRAERTLPGPVSRLSHVVFGRSVNSLHVVNSSCQHLCEFWCPVRSALEGRDRSCPAECRPLDDTAILGDLWLRDLISATSQELLQKAPGYAVGGGCTRKVWTHDGRLIFFRAHLGAADAARGSCKVQPQPCATVRALQKCRRARHPACYRTHHRLACCLIRRRASQSRAKAPLTNALQLLMTPKCGCEGESSGSDGHTFSSP